MSSDWEGQVTGGGQQVRAGVICPATRREPMSDYDPGGVADLRAAEIAAAPDGSSRAVKEEEIT